MKQDLQMRGQLHIFFTLASLLLVAVPKPSLASFSDLYDFVGGGSGGDGNNPLGNLVSDPSSPDTLYGITENGGDAGGPFGLGTVYTIDASTGAESVIHYFTSTDGQNPVGGLLLVTLSGGTKVLFGTTKGGPAPNNFPQVFRIKVTGSPPYADTISTIPGTGNQLVLGSNGFVYGTTTDGGTNGDGTFFRVDPTTSTPVAATVLSFGAPSSTYGSNPVGALLQNGTIGTTPIFYDCASSGETTHGGVGALFELSKPSGSWTKTDVTDLNGTNPGQSPTAGPVLVGGVMYFPTSGGGSAGHGTIQNDSGNTVWSFASNSPGYFPGAGMLVGSDGNLYGTTVGNAIDQQGVLFEYEFGTPPSMINLNSFDGTTSTDGLNCLGAPIEITDSSGTWLIGTTLKGGTDDNGTVYKGPFP